MPDRQDPRKQQVRQDHIEIEAKYGASPDFRLPDLADLAPGGIESAEHRLAATYFDTGDLRLAARRITLRRRTGGPDAGWHLKIPWGPDAKKEFHEPLGKQEATAPARLSRLVASATRGAPLVPTARISTDRTEYALIGASGERLALLADDAVSGEVLAAADGGDGHPSPCSWREVEVELASGPRTLLRSVGARLEEAGASPSTVGSKLLFVLGGRVPAPLPRPDGGSAGDVVLRYLWDQVQRLLDYDPRVRVDEEDAIHQMRVSTRRIRTVLQAFPSVVDRDATRPVADELRWLSGVLSFARDLEVMRELCARRFAELPRRAAGHDLTDGWLGVLDEQRRRSHDRILRELSGDRYFTLLDDLDRLRAEPPMTEKALREATSVLRRDVARACRRMDAAHDRAVAAPDAETRVTAWHDVRKAAKRARYAATLAQPVLGAPAKRIRAWATELQQVLGEHQDGVALQAYLDGNAPRLAPPGGIGRDAVLVTLGAMAGSEATTGRALIDRAERVWETGPDPKKPLGRR
ncbi:CHAD domain-containing protein [Nocardiopsis mwathae]|uniref:CHAD domain-containing protein n=1 Tax=Nocardiopsis mwathae TaxID=1472723 RepID=A0A7X0D6J6_9ACTN|nr:CHAD domain-containing protein [Nocardiopsis mwathae]